MWGGTRGNHPSLHFLLEKFLRYKMSTDRPSRISPRRLLIAMHLHILPIFSSLLGLVLSCPDQEHAVARKRGDIMLGGIFPIHNGVYNLLKRPHVNAFTCSRLQVRTMVDVLSMIYTIEKINNSTLLQGITLGYEIYDSCSDALKAVQGTLRLVPEIFAINNSTQCNGTEVVPAIKAVIGEVYSENSIAIGRILSSYFIPQVSGASSADILSDEIRYASFIRTIPRDYYQTRAIMDVIKTFRWNWIGMIANDDDYGRSALDSLTSLFNDNGICSAFTRIVPSYVEHPFMQRGINNAIDDLKTSTAKVIMVFAKGPVVYELFKEAIRQNISRTWIASDAWINSNLVASMDSIEKLGTIFGFVFRNGVVPGLKDYLRNLHPPSDGATNEFLDEYKTLRFGCTEDYRKYLKCLNSTSKNCSAPKVGVEKSPLACTVEEVSLLNDDYLVQNIETVYSTSLAVTAVAQALRNIICRNGTCDKDLQVSPRQLLAVLKENNFTYNNDTFHFNSFGEVLNGYDLINWQKRNQGPGSVTRVKVGQYNPVDHRIAINRSLLVWNNANSSAPFSNCTTTCEPGYYKKHSPITCCYECIACAAGTFSPAPDMAECYRCLSHQWSSNGSSRCEDKTVQYLQWKDPFAITLVAFASFGIVLVLLIGILFVRNANDSAVKAAGGHYSHLLMASLIFSLASIGLFIGEPSDLICQIRQPLYGISFTIAVSCILIKSILILIAFESAKQGKRVGNFSRGRSIIVVAALTGVQVGVCGLWLILSRPFSLTDNTIPQLIVRYCDEGSYVAFGVMLGYIGLLALTCFLLAYKGRNLPEKYNEARCITFSMLVYMFVWILFIPVYMNSRGMYLSAVQIVAILSSVFAVIGCHLLPVCYIVVFKQSNRNSSTIGFFIEKIRTLSIYINTSAQKSPSDEIQGTLSS